MKNFRVSVCFLIVLGAVTVFALPLDVIKVTKNFKRSSRGIKEWSIFSKTTKAPITTTIPPIEPNNLQIGHCEEEEDKIIYIDETRIESNNSTLGGVIEIYIDSPYYITCVKVQDQMTEGTGAVPSFNSGGPGKRFVFINVQGQHGHGIHFKIIVRGKLDPSENEIKQNESVVKK